MIKSSPSPELTALLECFEQRGGVIEFGFYEAEAINPTEQHHREAARLFMEEAALRFQEFLNQTDWEPIWKSHRKYDWNEALLIGRAISFAEFWGLDHLRPDCFIPSGFKTAFFWPPYNLSGGIGEENLRLFAEVCEHLFPGDHQNPLTIFAWNTDCSTYFKEGREWWGTFFWTVSSPLDRIVRVIAASSTD